ncbi:DUF86 domain-containing protein [Xenophilus aerolatus]|nr:DUF86 domain-containing protein [Xenophilus aerolatus]
MTAHPLRVADYLGHLAEAIDRILGYVAATDESGFRQNPMLQDAVIRNLEVIGEASRNTLRADPTFAERHPQLPLALAYDMRNQLSHAYFRIDLSTVWRTVHNDLPALRRQVEAVLSGLRSAGEA